MPAYLGVMYLDLPESKPLMNTRNYFWINTDKACVRCVYLLIYAHRSVFEGWGKSRVENALLSMCSGLCRCKRKVSFLLQRAYNLNTAWVLCLLTEMLEFSENRGSSSQSGKAGLAFRGEGFLQSPRCFCFFKNRFNILLPLPSPFLLKQLLQAFWVPYQWKGSFWGPAFRLQASKFWTIILPARGDRRELQFPKRGNVDLRVGSLAALGLMQW